ncbi:MAG: UDP-N-acetylmuramoyl-L-alanyl-D-glutamate--2,6-diaminopimelate ligase, partial [Candidatus Marinimicrobia bacterium]|nr:UDP-N-acetylmuramoyl-L-alanyl-D-glutamate--2,6-diaminopimelate ligase [Candidatus Neomarinimicrobiota bacterium]
LLKSTGKNVSMISSIKAVIGEKVYDTGFHVTTPDPREVQKYLRQAVNAGSEYMVLEVTSHALDQNRVAFCNFSAGVLTNITHEHLDYHKTYENYVKTKAKLLRMAKMAIVNRDDESYEIIKSKLKGRKVKLITYGIKNEANFTPQNFPFRAPLSGEFNDYNTLAALAVAKNLGVGEEKIREALLTFKPPEGRMEVVAKKPCSVMIDFAHTPNALEKVLYTSRFLAPGKIIVVFGCAGERDRAKRPIMGEIASRLADYVVVTTEDPRGEEPLEIIDQIRQGCKKAGGVEGQNFWRVPDRQGAINFAIKKLAHTNDLVIITGKGHEKSMCFGKKEQPWSDHEAVKRAIASIK